MRMKISIKIETTEMKTVLLFHFSRTYLDEEHWTPVKEEGDTDEIQRQIFKDIVL